MTLRRYLLSSLCGLCALAVSAGSFDEALSTLVSNNLAPRAEALRLEAEALNQEAENMLASPEAEFSRVWGSNAEVGNKWALSVSQSFDWPGVYAARREAARNGRAAAQYIREATLLDTRAEARQLLLEVIHLRQVLDMQRELATRIDSMVVLYRKGAEEGTETRLDYNKTVLERIAIHKELHTLEAQQAELEMRLQDFNGGKDPAGILALVGNEYPAAPAIPSAPGIEVVRQRDPAYAAAKAQSEAAMSLAKVENRSKWPGFSVGYVHETELGGNFDGFSVGITFPSFSAGKKARAARLEADAAMMDAEMQVIKVAAGMRGDLRRAAYLREVIEEYAPVIHDTENMRLLHKAFEAGQITYLSYIEESNYFISARRDYLDTLFEYHSLLGSLARYD